MRLVKCLHFLLSVTLLVVFMLVIWIHSQENDMTTPQIIKRQLYAMRLAKRELAKKHKKDIDSDVQQEKHSDYKPHSQETKENHQFTSTKASDLMSRTDAVREMCDKLASSSDPKPRYIMTNREHRLAYCFIPKCGCTFWKRVMRFLNRDYKGNVTSPFQIPRMETHLEKWAHPDTFLRFNAYTNITVPFTKFMFVREPYSRLWSAYVDKLYLPDLWQEMEPHIVSRRPKSEAKKCVNDVTFEEFLNLIHYVYEPHWQPMHLLCDPCTFKPSFVGRVESFSTDSGIILKHANLSYILEDYDHVTRLEEELATLIQYNLEDVVARKVNVSKCISKLGLMKRLWKTFQINGYIPKNVHLPSVDQNTSTAKFTDLVLYHHRQRSITPDVWRKQRKEFMIEAYRNVSTVTLNKIKQKYEKDFKLFNYDPSPKEIFGYRNIITVRL